MSNIELQIHGMESNEEARDYHRSRRAFIIKDSKVWWIPRNSELSHAEYCVSMGWNAKQVIDTCTRGYVKNDEIFFYIGPNFELTEEAFKCFLEYISDILTEFHSDNFKIYGGVKIGNVGEQWQPIKYFGYVREIIVWRNKINE